MKKGKFALGVLLILVAVNYLPGMYLIATGLMFQNDVNFEYFFGSLVLRIITFLAFLWGGVVLIRKATKS